MKTVLLHSYQKEHYYHGLALKSSGCVFGIGTASLSEYLHNEQEEGEPVLLLKAAHLLKKDESIQIYRGMLSYPSFIREIVRFASKLAQYGISADALPERNQSEQELKHILSKVLTLPLPGKNAGEKKNDVIQSLSDNPGLSILESFETDYFQYEIMEQLKQHVPVIPLRKGNPEAFLHYALNTRQEIESIAQKICVEGRTANIILASWQSQYPVLQQVFARYGIPYSSVRKDRDLHIPLIYQTLVQLAAAPSRETMLKALHAGAFTKPCPDHLLAWLNETLAGTDAPSGISSRFKESPLEDEASSIAALGTAAAEYFSSIKKEKDLLLSSRNPKDILANAYAILQKSPYLKHREELSAGMEIRSVLESGMNLVETKEDDLFLVECLSAMQAKGTLDNEAPVHVTDLTHPVDAAEASYVVGCSGDHFPGFPSEKGLFDESYTACIHGWPSMNDRHKAYISQLEWIKGSSTMELNYSYPTNDYQGREIQPAYEVESLFPKNSAEKYPLLEKEPYHPEEHALSVDTAKKIFAPDGTVRGSISTIERWFQCPYAYFIQSGLKVRKKAAIDLDAALMGKAQHTVMEKAVRLYGKSYAEIEEEKIDAFLYPYFAAISKAHPLKETEIILAEERLVHSLSVSMQFLNDMERNTPFVPKETEKQFTCDIIRNVSIHGIIDRLDETDALLRILDYKSSEKILSEKNVKAGLSLQLLTYVMIARRIWDRMPVGSYYFSMKEKAFDVPASRTAGRGRNKTVAEADFSPEALKSTFINQRRIAGWTFDETHLTELDRSGTHVSTRTIYDYARSEECLSEVYQYFRDHLFSGDIRVDPVENACTFCDYRPVCRFHGQCRKPEALVMQNADLKKSKEEKKA